MQSLLSIALLLAATATAFLAPLPTGKYNVTLNIGELVDYSRNDIYAAKPMPRALMLSIFQPAECASTIAVEDMPKKTAKYQGPFLEQLFKINYNISPLFLKARLPVCASHRDVCGENEDFPVLLFSPGYSVPRLYYSVIASAIASEGFVVITIDHPHDADIIEYPDGTTLYNNGTILDNPYWDTFPRAADMSFVIDQLGNATAVADLLPERGPRPFKTDAVGSFGHSCGGASAVLAAYQDSRIKAAVNWDAELLGNPTVPANLTTPILLMERANVHYPYWDVAWPKFKGPKLEIRVKHTKHQDFSDVPTLFNASGQSTASLSSLFGTIEAAVMVNLLTTWTTTWMTSAFHGKVGGRLLQGKKAAQFPNVEIIRKGNY